MENKRMIFMGSPEYALPILKMLSEEYKIVGVVTQPDQPVGRGKKIQSPPVKILADEKGIPVFQPERLKTDDFNNLVSGLAPDVIVVAAYGKILPKSILNIPKHGCINVHASLLPRWRGASPIQHAILSGDDYTGVTIMLMDAGMDTGDVLAQSRIRIESQDTAGTLTEKLANEGSSLLRETLLRYLENEIEPSPQPEEGITYTRLIEKGDARMDFSKPAELLEREVRAFNPWPISFFEWGENFLRIYRAEACGNRRLKAGERGIADKYPAIGTASKDLKLIEIQPAGKRVMNGQAFLNGARDWIS